MPKAKIVGEEQAAPQPLHPLIGQERAVAYFHRIGPQALAHAYLFTGSRGIGKTTFARTLALTLHCERPRSFPTGYCGECSACRRGLSGSSGDTIFVDLDFIRLADELAGVGERKTETLGIETSRLIVRRMQMKSYEGGRLVCIIPNFENVPYERDEVYNALLKELEEPDAGKLFLLTAERPERLLPTIRSRTVTIRFDPLSEEQIRRALVDEYGESDERAATLARGAQGSLGLALEQRGDEASEIRSAAQAWALSCLSQPKVLPPMPLLGKEDARAALDAVLRHARVAVRDVLVLATVGENAVMDVEALPQYRKTVGALGAGTALTAMRALALFDEAANLAATNIAPASVLGWLQVQLRRTAAPT